MKTANGTKKMAASPPIGPKSKKIEGAKTIGEKIAKMAKEKGIKEAVFDRGRYKYHGVIKIIVETARKNGLKI